MKTAISLPDQLYHQAEKLAARLGIPRSQLYARALADYLELHSDSHVTAALDQLYSETPSRVDQPVADAQASVLDDEW